MQLHISVVVNLFDSMTHVYTCYVECHPPPPQTHTHIQYMRLKKITDGGLTVIRYSNHYEIPDCSVGRIVK